MEFFDTGAKVPLQKVLHQGQPCKDLDDPCDAAGNAPLCGHVQLGQFLLASATLSRDLKRRSCLRAVVKSHWLPVSTPRIDDRRIRHRFLTHMGCFSRLPAMRHSDELL